MPGDIPVTAALPRIEGMREEHLPAVLRVQAECYPPSMQEDAAALRSRLEAAHATAWVAVGGAGVCAYLFAYPSLLGKITPLGGAFHVPDDADTLYLHDLAVSRRAAGMGIGPALVGIALATAKARALRHSALVSVQDSLGFWRRLGYEASETRDAGQSANLLSYDGMACYMTKVL